MYIHLVWPHCDIIWLPFPNLFFQHFQTFNKNPQPFELPWNSQDVFRTLQQGRYRDVLGRAWVETSAKIHIEDVGICTAHPLKNGGKGRLLSYWGPIHMLLKKEGDFFCELLHLKKKTVFFKTIVYIFLLIFLQSTKVHLFFGRWFLGCFFLFFPHGLPSKKL